MEFKVEIKGITPILMRSSDSVNTRTPAAIEKAAITGKGSRNRTESDESRLREIECITSLWLNWDNRPTIPASAIRACIETAAKKHKQGTQVRQGGLFVLETSFTYDTERYGTTLEELAVNAQYTTVVSSQGPRKGGRFLRTRPKFDIPWSCVFTADTDEELVDKTQLESWLDIAGRRIGLGDWRPEKSGIYGRFEVVSIDTE